MTSSWHHIGDIDGQYGGANEYVSWDRPSSTERNPYCVKKLWKGDMMT